MYSVQNCNQNRKKKSQHFDNVWYTLQLGWMHCSHGIIDRCRRICETSEGSVFRKESDRWQTD